MTTVLTPSSNPPQPDPSSEDMTALLEAQRAAHLLEGIPDLETRLDRVDRFALAILEHAEEIAVALHADFGMRSEVLSLGTDVSGVISKVEELRANLADWLRAREVPGSAESGVPTFIQVRPKGVVGVIGPWNFPVGLIASPTLEALGAGNRVMIKMSEIPHRTAEVVAKAVASRMSPEEVVVVRGDAKTAAAFSALRFDHIIFTGSPQVGAYVAKAAGENLVPVTLELGGKNPVVVGADADVAFAAQRVSEMRLFNGGQVCLSPDYVFVPRDKVDDFVTAFETNVRSIFPTYAENPGAVSIVNDRNYARVTALIDDAELKGASVIRMLPADEAAMLPNPAARRIPVTLILNATEDMEITREEIFGPVIVVWPYDEVSQPVAYVNSRPSPLGAYWFGNDGEDFQEFLDKTTSGGVTRNDLGLHWNVPGTPSGGVGRSGMGAYTGKVGFDTFSHLRTVTTSELPVSAASRLLPPNVGDENMVMLSGIIEQVRGAIAARVEREA
ncbi:aldehyde dehydrogenase family protein [Streptomyces scopuliridis]|uniref:aldehyde dehydrogenase family protein n=1 Tax=Streptomyces scopuliridis TaxID=452529 RepID=UPI00342A8E04